MLVRSYLIILALGLIPCTSYAKYESLELKNYSEITKVVEKEMKAYSPDELLVVFDLDRTVLNTSDCLSDKDSTPGFLRFEKVVINCGAP